MVEGFDFDEKWRELRGRFLGRLDERARSIGLAWIEVRNGRDPDGAAQSALFHQIHSLSGSGATFGFAELSAAARRVEPLVDPARRPAPEVTAPARQAKIDAALADLEREMRRIQAAAQP